MPLPQPDANAAAHSRRVLQHVEKQIEAAGGWLSFAAYMELVLYAPGLGYYSAGAAKFGEAGDFITAPELSPLFGRALAAPVAAALRQQPGDILEIGAGSGRLAVDLLRELQRRDELPARYCILELSADLRERQRDLLARELPALFERIIWLAALPASFRGVVLGNEVLDALPVHLVHRRENQLFERGVGWHEGALVWRDRSIVAGELHDLARARLPGDDYLSEISLAVPAFLRAIAASLQAGSAIFIDYGFAAHEFYHPQRHRGTLMCHYRHHAHDDPFFFPGLQDITAHVDFTATIDAAVESGMSVVTYTTQAHFLLDCGITDLLAEIDPSDVARYLPLASQAQRLLSPAEMGELFKVLVVQKTA